MNQDVINVCVNVINMAAPYALVWALGIRIVQILVGFMSGKDVKQI